MNNAQMKKTRACQRPGISGILKFSCGPEEHIPDRFKFHQVHMNLFNFYSRVKQFRVIPSPSAMFHLRLA